MQFPRLLTIGLAALLLAACATEPAPAKPHGYVEGATEAAEPQLHLAAVSSTGELTLLDLLDETTVVVGDLGATSAVTTNGRYVFATTPTGVTIADTGVWTIDHEDHFHYYRAQPRILGTVQGDGPATVSSDTLGTAIFFAGSGETVLLDSAALGSGELTELARIVGEPHNGLAVVQGKTVLISSPGSVRAHDLTGTPIARAENCPDLRGSITTRVGVVIGCSTGALLYTDGFETIDYPDAPAAPDRAVEFRNRAGRPTAAAIAADTGYWLLDSREREWKRFATEPLAQVAAVDDREGHIVALSAEGRVLVFDADGAELARTAVLSTGGELTVDAGRAYLNDPAGRVVYEIDYADGARIAREFALDAAFLVETGR